MEHNSTYKIYKKDRFVCITHVGLIRLESLNKYISDLVNSCDFCKDFNFIIDLREAKYTRNTHLAYRFVYQFRRNYPELIRRKYAILADSPEQIAMASIFRFLVGGISRNVYVFSAIEEAMVWLGVKMEAEEIVGAFDRMNASL